MCGAIVKKALAGWKEEVPELEMQKNHASRCFQIAQDQGFGEISGNSSSP
jgi:hypothetical protein